MEALWRGAINTFRNANVHRQNLNFRVFKLSVVQADPSKVDSKNWSGLLAGEHGSISAAQIAAANAQESAAHELLGHLWPS
jgi:hypothetical protein